ncbi:unnamed protein product [Prorocentrum cordatum]|uniref:Cyclin-like domain-containing protein n=1 Tax=Prorocentrum cordatum TaxID=2364126 RepID=A0ABN9YFT0_9DINO|nr:unnamed protein product [Polarella glacialis]
MLGPGDAAPGWLFSAEGLARARQQAHDRAAETLGALSGAAGGEEQAAAASGGAAGRELARPLCLEEAGSLASFYAQKLPELCGLCGASGDVRWTAMVFYRRFFAVCSPMEHDPLPAMFACVHLACKVEEEHHITLEKLLAAADLGSDRAMQGKVVDSEICVLEGAQGEDERHDEIRVRQIT